MTTTTETPTADRRAELATAKERFGAAQAERDRIDAEYLAWDKENQEAEAELDHLARTEREQFEGGRPRPKTRAAALEKKIAEAKKAKWKGIIDGADERVTETGREVGRLTASLDVELAREAYELGIEAKQRLLPLRDQMLVVVGEMRAREPELLAITSAVGGAINGQAMTIDPLLEEVEGVLNRLDGLEPARIPTMTPYEDEDVLIVRTQHGWSKVGRAGEIDPDLQPERIERPS